MPTDQTADAVFVVIGTTGEYSDRSEWVVCVYVDEAVAQAHADAAKREAQRIEAIGPHYSSTKPDDRAKIWDPDMSIDYTGTNYYVERTTLRVALPEEI